MTIQNPQTFYDAAAAYGREADVQYGKLGSANQTLQDLLPLGNEATMKTALEQGRNYEKPLLDQQARIVEKNNLIAQKYRGDSEMSVSQRNRLTEQEMAGNNREATALGAYMTARSGSLADTIKAWKEAFTVRYGATELAAKQAETAWNMAFKQQESNQGTGFGIEKQQTSENQWSAEMAQKEQFHKDDMANAAANRVAGETSGVKFDFSKDGSGGYQFYAVDPSTGVKKPVSAYQYLAGTYGAVNQQNMGNLLAASGNANDKKYGADILSHSYSMDAIKTKYPRLF